MADHEMPESMSWETKDLVIDLEQYLEGVSQEERVQFFKELLDRFCRYCGRQLGKYDICQCNNDR
jgi:hypothetical protein